MQRSQQKDADYESGAADRAREINKDRRGERERDRKRWRGGEKDKHNRKKLHASENKQAIAWKTREQNHKKFAMA